MSNQTIMQKLLENYDQLDLIKLPSELKKGGFDYKLIKRTNEKCLYAQILDGKIISFEVFKTKIVKHRENMIRLGLINPDSYPEFKESFPNDEDFGKRAHCYPNLEMAEQAYDGLS